VRRLAITATLAAGCGGTEANSGLDAELRVAGGQFYAGAMTAPTIDTRVTAIDTFNNAIRAGQINKSLSGRVERAGTAVALGLSGDLGYWIVPTGVLDVNQVGQRDWSAKVSFSPALADGEQDLQVAALDGSGRFGPPEVLSLNVRPHEVDLTGTKLVISLSWDTEADLDLHVIVPSTPPITVWSQHPTSYVPPLPGDPVDPNAIAAAGILDVDSNSQCLIDGRHEENVIWRGAVAAPPHGSYAVLVDTFSLCAAQTAHWTVDVYRDGDPTPTAHAVGTVVDADTRGDHVASSGVRAVTFDY